MVKSCSICIVDDAADYRFLIQEVFRRYQPVHKILTFADGQELLDALSAMKRLPDLILLDQHMPRLDGHQTLQQLKSQPEYRKIPVVMMSAYASKAEINASYDVWVNSFMNKGQNFVEMTQQVNLICRYWLEANEPPYLEGAQMMPQW